MVVSRRVSWQLLFVIALVAVIVTAILVAHFGLAPTGGPHHLLHGIAGGASPDGDGGFAH